MPAPAEVVASGTVNVRPVLAGWRARAEKARYEAKADVFIDSLNEVAKRVRSADRIEDLTDSGRLHVRRGH
jgi:hypothetical protein